MEQNMEQSKKENLENILAKFALFFQTYEIGGYAGGIMCKNEMIDDQSKRTVDEHMKYKKMTQLQATEFQNQLKACQNLMPKFVNALEAFVQDADFSLAYDKMPNALKDFILYLHTDSYKILRQVKQPLEIVTIDKQELLNNFDVKYSPKIREIFELPEIFNNLPENKLQLLKQRNYLEEQGYDVSKLNGSFERNIYGEQLIKLLLESKPVEQILDIYKKIEITPPWYIKHVLYFIENNEKHIQSKKHTI